MEEHLAPVLNESNPLNLPPRLQVSLFLQILLSFQKISFINKLASLIIFQSQFDNLAGSTVGVCAREQREHPARSGKHPDLQQGRAPQ